MHTGVVFIGCLCLVCFAIQLLPVISVPLTGASINYNLHFSLYNNITFGVFGVCDIVENKCSKVAIGYPKNTYDDAYQDFNQEPYDEDFFSPVSLPSGATHLISKLLVVHIVAFILTGILTLECIFVMLITHVDKKYPGAPVWVLFQRTKSKYKVDGESADGAKRQRPKRNLLGHFSWMLLLSALSFLLTLLAFLADIILFIPRLSFLGWIQLLPIALMALIASLLCFLKRSILSRRHLDEENKGKNDDMRNNGVMPRWIDDSASDDGFYVFTNGFYSSGQGPDDEVDARRSSSLRQTNTNHSLRNFNTNNSIDSHDVGELIELRRME